MTSESILSTVDKNCGDSNPIQLQLSTILAELSSLKQEVHGNSYSVSSEVKKLKTEQDIKWRFEGNKVQFNFNNELLDAVKQATWALEHGKREYCIEQLSEFSDKLQKRNKLIRIADSSEGGWETVRQYESNPVASDSEDETKIHRAESRALKKKRSSRGKGRDFANTRQPVQSPFLTGVGRARFCPYGSFCNASGYGPGSTSGFGYNAGFGRPPAPGPCFACGETTYFRRNCPHVRAGAQSDQPSGSRKREF